MKLVGFAMRFPHTFYVLAGLMLFLGCSAILVTPKDIFPSINIPVVTVIWQYSGLSPAEMEQRVTTYSVYSISSSVSDVRNIDSQTLEGIAVEKVYFQPKVDIGLAIAQLVSASNSIRALMPAGIQPPVIVQYNASSVPVLQLSLSSDTLNEQQLYDYGLYQIRQQLAPIPGITLPTPAGGKYRQVMVYLDLDALRAHGVTPNDVVNAVNAQNLTLPAGDAKLGDKQFIVRVDAMPLSVEALQHLTIKQVGATTVYLSDVAHVADSWLAQANIVHAAGKRSVLLTIIKNGDASTLDVVNRVKAALPSIQKAAPPGMQIHMLFDQSVFVQNAIASVLREGAIAGGLTALMIMLFLGSWRSIVVVMVSIPLSILTSVTVMVALGQTINTMTLGGLALAVGILVDDSTVTIENTHRLLEEGQPFDRAVLEAAASIAVPTLISTLAICCVFVSVFFLEGAPKYLFTPLAMAVVFSMLASYAISRTLTPIVIRLLLRKEHATLGAPRGWFGRAHDRFNAGFDRFRDFYGWLLGGILRRRVVTPLVACSVVADAVVIAQFAGSDFFPQVDAGLIELHVRAPARTRIERTEQIFHEIEANIRQQIPPSDRSLVLDNIGLPARPFNLAFSDGTTIGVNDGQILLQLNEGHGPTADYVKKLRRELPTAFPDVAFYFQPADMATQVLNFGLPAQIDVQVQGRDRAANQAIAKELQKRLAAIPGVADSHVQQELDVPEFEYTVNRTRAQELGLNVAAIGNDVNISLSSSEQVSPNFWTDPHNGIPYFFAVQTPEFRITSKQDIDNTPIAGTTSAGTVVPDLLGNVASAQRVAVQSVYNHSNIQPVYDVYASVQDRDLGSVAAAIRNEVRAMQGRLGPADRIVILGQINSMDGAFTNLTIGLLFAAVFVYALMVVNYQSFVDPLAVILALPGAGSGIVLLLFATGTTFSVPSLMGAIMAVGVASANSILLVTFAREQREGGMSAFQAALSAGTTRLRPVLMTAAAMIVGMLPMAIGGIADAPGSTPMNQIPSQPLETLPSREVQQSAADPSRERRRRHAARWAGFIAVVALAGLAGAGAWGHARRRAETAATLTAERDAVPLVRTEVLKPRGTPPQIELTGSAQAFNTATLFARATGYISKRSVDIGSRVHAGDVLAVIAAPDLDQQFAQARAQLVQLQASLMQSQANRELAEVTDRRQSQLTRLGWTSQQGGDQARLGYASSIAAVEMARANVQAQQAQVNRLQEVIDFERVVAPFDGVITSRQIDVGSLVAADANSGTPLFAIAHTNVLRVQIYVPQEDFFRLKDGQQAEVTVPELPGRVFRGRLARNASALQDATRTVLAEVDVDNQDGTLAPGIYAVVRLDESQPYPLISVPSQALIFDKDGLQAVVDEDGVARIRHLDVAADNGGTVDVRAGLKTGDRLILNPPIGVTDGMPVRTLLPPQETASNLR